MLQTVAEKKEELAGKSMLLTRQDVHMQRLITYPKACFGVVHLAHSAPSCYK